MEGSEKCRGSQCWHNCFSLEEPPMTQEQILSLLMFKKHVLVKRTDGNFYSQIYVIAEDDLELIILLPLPPECWGNKCLPRGSTSIIKEDSVKNILFQRKRIQPKQFFVNNLTKKQIKSCVYLTVVFYLQSDMLA